MRRLLTLLLLGALFSPAARAMEFLSSAEDGTTIIVGLGDIRRGDEQRFSSLLGRLEQQYVLVLDSPGGSLWAANAMRASVMGSGMTVFVPSDATCASACFLLFAAARERIVGRGARIGVHSVANGLGVESVEARAATTDFARVARRDGIPDAIVGRISTTPANQMAWLSEADILNIPNTRIADLPPVRAPRPLPREAGPPQAWAPAAPAASSSGGGYAQGRADWAATESWLFGQPKAVRAGAESWIGRRSRQNPGGCEHPDPDFVRGCMEARRRFSPIDARRTTDPEYRRGFSPG